MPRTRQSRRQRAWLFRGCRYVRIQLCSVVCGFFFLVEVRPIFAKTNKNKFSSTYVPEATVRCGVDTKQCAIDVNHPVRTFFS